jgi:hypothetical protein
VLFKLFFAKEYPTNKTLNTANKILIDNDLIFNSSRDLARIKALQCRESGSWLHAIPSNIKIGL